MKRALFLGLFLVGCGSNVAASGGAAGSAQGGSTTTTAGGGGAGGSEPVPGSQSLTFGPKTIAPGEENTQCIQGKLKNLDILRVHQIHNVLSQGSHHMIVYRTADTEEKLTPYDCQPFKDTLDPSKGSPLMITQKHDETLTLPDNVAFTFDPEQMIRLEVHFLNATDKSIDMTATTTFVPIADADFKYEADFLFLGDPDIKIPASSKLTLGPVFMPLGKLLPDLVPDAKFFAITGHEHQWGTRVKVDLVTDANDPGTPVYDPANWSWAEPETVRPDPEFSITKDGGFKLTCEWDNKSASEVGFGESANDEMCFFWAYYYPSKGAHVCAHSEQAPQFGTDLCCPGNALCQYLLNN